MVTQQILVLFFQVRILVVQHEAFLISGKAFFVRGGWFRGDVKMVFFSLTGIFQKSSFIFQILS